MFLVLQFTHINNMWANVDANVRFYLVFLCPDGGQSPLYNQTYMTSVFFIRTHILTCTVPVSTWIWSNKNGVYLMSLIISSYPVFYSCSCLCLSISVNSPNLSNCYLLLLHLSQSSIYAYRKSLFSTPVSSK